MTNMRKYSNYSIKVTYNNGDTEDITLKGINTSNYKEMLKVYNDVKEDHKNDSCIIDFVGVSDSGELGILFTKEIKVETNNTEKMKMTTEDILEEMNELLKVLQLKRKYYLNGLGERDKIKNDIEHEIEAYEGNNLGKIELFDRLQNAERDRREVKKELRFIKYVESKEFHKQIKEIKINIDNFKKSSIKAKSKFVEGTIKEEYNIIKEVTYKNDRERINLMKQLKPKYDKAVVDEINKKITFYNNGYTCDKNKKAM
jgi:hypothetical protein